jgi:hypothetical protein
MYRIKKHQLAMNNSGSRLYFDCAIALSTIIPLLSVGLLISPAFETIDLTLAQYTIIIFGLVLTPAAGLAMLWRYPVIIMRLRTYLEGIIQGEIPDKITLVACEADLAFIEHAMNLILETLRQRVMIESLGAVCHHMCQPMTVITSCLDLIPRQTSGEAQSSMIEQCRTAVDEVNALLGKLQNVSFYRSEPYLTGVQGEASVDRILTI